MKNKKKGFTIVELVIVIAVIGILSAILIPTFANLTKDAKGVALQHNLRNAYDVYALDVTNRGEDAANQVAVVLAAEELTLSVEEGHEGEITFSNQNAIAGYMCDQEGHWSEVTSGTYKLEKVVVYDTVEEQQVERDQFNNYYVYVIVA